MTMIGYIDVVDRYFSAKPFFSKGFSLSVDLFVVSPFHLSTVVFAL